MRGKGRNPWVRRRWHQGMVEAVAVDSTGTVLAVCVANGVQVSGSEWHPRWMLSHLAWHGRRSGYCVQARSTERNTTSLELRTTPLMDWGLHTPCLYATQVLELPSGQALFHVEGHTAVVTAVAFCRHMPHLLVTAAEDRTFKVSVKCNWGGTHLCLLDHGVLCQSSKLSEAGSL
jgi:hypothetical protein